MKHAAVWTLVSCVVGLSVSVIPIFIVGTSVMIIPITVSTGWSRADVSLIISTGLVSVAVGTAITGRLIGMFGPRRVIISCTLCFAASLACFSLAPSLSEAIVFSGLVGLFGAGASQFAYIHVLPLWFDRRLGLSLAIAMMGIGIGTSVMPMLFEYLSRSISWRNTFVVMAAGVLIIALPNAIFLLRVPPAHAIGDAAASRNDHDPIVPEILRRRQFWQLAICMFLATALIAGFGVHLTALMTDRGYKAARAAQIFSLWGVAQMASRFVGGVILDYCDARWVGVIVLLSAACGAVVVAGGGHDFAALIGVALLASAHGIDGDLVPYLTREYFGLKSYSTVFGLLGLAFGLGPVVGALAMGRTFDRFGSYTPMLWAISAGAVVCAILLAAMGRPPPRLRTAEPV
jgi:OFA family oxalate/formate antiporter-like MFS transporter